MESPKTHRPRPLVLVILDGFGERQASADNAIRLAKTPALDALFAEYPHGLIGASGPDVGLPPGQMGNSEVGHLNFGAGRIAMMDITRIDRCVYDGTLGETPAIRDAVSRAKAKGGRLHLLGLVSDGGVHSLLTHLIALIDVAARQSVPVVVHAFLDGRDVQPGTGRGYVEELERKLAGRGVIGSVSGRYYGMDRDNRWERVEKAYRCIAEGVGPRAKSALSGISESYEAGVTDEFVIPFVVGDYDGIHANDAAIHFNFRPDRAREMTRALTVKDFAPFARRNNAPPLTDYACMTAYDAELSLPIAFSKDPLPNIFPEVLAKAGIKQFRCAETEKYAHVTYFFNGGREEPFAGEDRKMIPSPKDVATYDEKPEMAAGEVAAAVHAAITADSYDFILVNFANPDMVGHTGLLAPAIHAVEATDRGVAEIVKATLSKGGAVMITADHGNCELMKDPESGNPHTAHTTNPVPFLYVNKADSAVTVRAGGRICDVAPTMLEVLGIPKPAEMTGVSLLVRA